MADPVEYRLLVDFAHPAAEAFAWLTDIQDDDTTRAGAVLESRRVIERSKDRIVYRGETRMLGRRSHATTEVTLSPPDRWQARVIEGPRTGTLVDYHIVARRAGTRLAVTYRFVFADPKTTFRVRLLKPLVRYHLGRMWAGFARSMDTEVKG